MFWIRSIARRSQTQPLLLVGIVLSEEGGTAPPVVPD